jgi:hypothetical protein
MRLVRALKTGKYLGAAVLGASAMGLFLPLVQTGFGPDSMLAWYLALAERPLSAALYIAFSVLFGMLVSLQLYNRQMCMECGPDRRSRKGSGVGAVGTVFGFAIGICPACIGLAGIFVPLSVSIALTSYSWIFMGVAVIAMLVSLKMLGGFRK